MSYLVLARKYRPKTFAEVTGQEIVTRTLQGAISEERIGHAYLFHGPRGTGKTTSARLFAKALNCARGPIAEPCGECDRCAAFDAGTEADLIEIDAASNTGVDHVRALRDQALYAPLSARFKVFLIDEVHMLSKPAFNALLKTLEEPPPHVKFLFATTELHKVLDTVKSRCQLLALSPLSETEIQSRLDEVFELEGVTASDGVTAELARRARGGMRDALSLADQLLALVGREPSLEDTQRLAGEGADEAIEPVLDAILAADKRAVLQALPAREGGEPAFLDALLDHLRSSLLLALVGNDAPMAAESASTEVRARMAARATSFGGARLELVLQELLHARERIGAIHMRAHARLVLETTLLDLCRPEATMPIDELCRRLEALEGRLASGAALAPAPVPAREPAREPALAPAAAPAPRSKAVSEPTPKSEEAYVPPTRRNEPESAPAATRERRAPQVAPRVQTNSTADRWNGFLVELGSRSPELQELIGRKGKLVRDLDGVAPLKLHDLTDDERAMVGDRRNARTIQAAFAAAIGDAVRLNLELHDPKRGGDTDPFTSEIAELFGGRVED